ncbi:MAG: glycosyltransferase [Bacilli bacterium]
MKKLSFLIPCYGSELTIEEVVNEIKKIVIKKKYDYEIILINDQSPDNVWKVIQTMALENKNIKAINLAKNMNKPGAIMAGLSVVSGDYVIFLDDDGQCPMNRLWDLLKPLENGFDVSIAKYSIKKQSKFKNFGSKVNKKMSEIIINKPKNLYFTNFMVVKKFVALEMIKYDNPYPYIEGLVLRITNNIKNVVMEERERISGNPTFTFKKMLSMWFNGFTCFSVKPLRIATYLGFCCALFGFIFGIYIIINRLINPTIIQGYSSLMAIILFIGGTIMIMLGLVGEYIGRIYISINNSPQYVVKETINIGSKNEKN